MNFLDLFSGIGGFALAADRAGWDFENHLFSEIHEPAIRIYKKHFPDGRNLGDIKQIDCAELKEQYGSDWIITGGFPCQDLSTAGYGAGIARGSRSNLWFEMLRTIRDLQPTFAIIENVAQINTRGLDRVVCGLAESGYDASWKTVPAFAVGLPHRRNRTWIIAHHNMSRLAGSRELCPIFPDLGEVNNINLSAHRDAFFATWQREAAERKIHPESLICRTDDGLPDRMDRIRALGNAIVPAIAERILRRLKELHDLDTCD